MNSCGSESGNTVNKSKIFDFSNMVVVICNKEVFNCKKDNMGILNSVF